MKYLKKIFIVIVVLFSIIYTFDLNYFIKGIRVVYLNGYTTVFIDDNEYFDTVEVKTSNTPETWPKHINYNKINTSRSFDEFNAEMETAAFLVFKNDSIKTGCMGNCGQDTYCRSMEPMHQNNGTQQNDLAQTPKGTALKN